MSSIRFQADSNLKHEIIKGITRAEPAIDFRTAEDANLRGLLDDKVLSIAKEDDRILVTHDRKTMPDHFARFIKKHDCPGVLIVSRKMATRDVIDSLLLVWYGSDSTEWTNRIAELPI